MPSISGASDQPATATSSSSSEEQAVVTCRERKTESCSHSSSLLVCPSCSFFLLSHNNSNSVVHSQFPEQQRRADMVTTVVAGLDVGSGRTKMEIVQLAQDGTITKTLFSRHTAVFYSNDFAVNGKEFLSEDIMSQGFAVLKEYKDIADSFGTTHISGAATQVFRLAKNGEAFLARVNKELKMNIRVVSQDCEGQIGFLTAASEATSPSLQNVIAYDSGAGSFQITYLARDAAADGDDDDDAAKAHLPKVTVYGGHWGTVPAREALMTQVRNAARLEKGNDPNPVSREEMDALVDHIQGQLAPPPAELKSILADPDAIEIVAIGEESSIFAIVQQTIDQYTFTQDDVSRALDICADRSTKFFKQSGYPESFQVVPKICLLLAVMRKFDMKTVNYKFTNGGCRGVILMDAANRSALT